MLTLDHLVISATDLAADTATIEAVLGVPLAPGGQHADMGTHNRLLSLGPDEYLEIIAIDPQGTAPGQPRWFGLDGFGGGPRLTNWAAQTSDLNVALAAAPHGAGRPWDLARGDLRWRMAVPQLGNTPFDGLFPALLQWQTPGPAPRLPERGLRLEALTLLSPVATTVQAALAPLIEDPRITVKEAAKPGIQARLSTPNGPVTL